MKHKQEANEQENPMPGVTDQALKNCQQAIRNGLKLQQELARYWTGVISQGASAPDWQKRVSGFAATSATLIPAAQKRVEEIMELTEKNYKAGADLLKKATDAAQTASVAESQTKWLDVWTSSIQAARTNAESIVQINNRLLDSWMEFARKNADAAQVRVEQAA